MIGRKLGASQVLDVSMCDSQCDDTLLNLLVLQDILTTYFQSQLIIFNNVQFIHNLDYFLVTST